jgi:HEAT repeat protein
VNAKSKDGLLRAAAFEAFGFLQSDRANDVLKKGLQDSDLKARWSAAASLARLHGAKVWEDLRPLLGEPDPQALAYEVMALGFIRNEESRKRFSALTSHKDRNLRIAAIRAMHRTEDPWCVGHLLGLLVKYRDAESSRNIRGVLLSCDETFIAEPLAAVIRDAGKDVLPHAIDLLLERPDRKCGDALADRLEKREEMHVHVLLKALDTLLGIDPKRYQETLLKYLDSDQPPVRSRAVMALTADRAEAELFGLLQKPLSDPDDGVFRQALGLLQSSTTGTPKGGLADYLRLALEKPSLMRATAILNFLKARLPDKELTGSLDLLSPFLGHKDARVRKLAVEIYSKATDEELYRKVAAAQGFITDWMLLGPYDNDKLNSGFQKAWEPEHEINLAAEYGGGSDRARFIQPEKAKLLEETPGTGPLIWQPHRVASTSGRISLNRLLTSDADYILAYATAEVHSDVDRQVVLEIRGDDGFRCWLNGKQVAGAGDKAIDPKVLKDREKWMAIRAKWKNNIHSADAEVSLKKGKNRILLKVGNFTDYWFFSVRVRNK